MIGNIKIGLAGFGTVGRGTWELFESNKTKIEDSTNNEIWIVGIADPDKQKFEGVKINSGCVLYSDAFELLKDNSINVVIELIGGETVAKEFVLAAIRKKKFVVLSKSYIYILQ